MNPFYNEKIVFMEMLMKHCDFHDFVKFAHTFVDYPIIVTDGLFRIVSAIGNQPLDDGYDISKIRIEDATENQKYRDGVAQYIVSDEPFIFDDPHLPQRRLYLRLRWEEETYGYLIFIESTRNLSELDPEKLKFLQSVFTILNRNYHARAIVTSPQRAMHYLLEGITTTTQQLNNCSTFYEKCDQGPFKILIFSKATEKLIQEAQKRLRTDWFASLDNKLVFLLDNQNAMNDKETQDMHSLLKEFQVSAVLSDEFADLLQMRDQYHAVKKVLCFLPEKEFRIFEFEKYKIDVLLAFCKEKHIDLTTFKSRVIDKINDYDQQNNTDFYRTLKEYLECGKNIADTAKIMFVHKNTIAYRLDRIQNLFNIDLHDYRTCLNLQLGILIYA